MNLRLSCWLAAAALSLAGCATSQPRSAADTSSATAGAAPAAAAPRGEDTRYALAWLQTAAEYDAQNLMVYAAARAALDAALADPARDALPAAERARTGKDPRTLPPAIILDIDETVLENTPFNVDLLTHPIDESLSPAEWVAEFDRRWVAWVGKAAAPRMGGAKEFLDYVAARGVAIRYVTNRSCKPGDPAMCEEEPTCRNLRAQELPLADCERDVLLRHEQEPYLAETEKGSRRVAVGSEFRVLLVLGDNLGDFLDGVATSVAAREELVCAARSHWGVDWFVLSNPVYGSWPRAAENLPAGSSFATAAQRREAHRRGIDAALVAQDAATRLRTPCLPAAAAGN